MEGRKTERREGTFGKEGEGEAKVEKPRFSMNKDKLVLPYMAGV